MMTKKSSRYTHRINPGILELSSAWRKPANGDTFTRLKKARQYKRYFLGKNHPSVYFTTQEAHCLFYFLQGLSSTKISPFMQLSPRTITYYCEKMRRKMGGCSKKKLIEWAKASDFMRHLPEIEKRETLRQKRRSKFQR